MAAIRLNDRLLKTLPASSTGKAAVWHDSEVKGFQFKRTPQGRGSFLVYYRTPDGAERRPKIGDWPSITVEQARKAARDMLARVSLGQDPSAERQAARVAEDVRDRLSDVVPLFIERHAKPNNRSWAEADRIFRVYVLPRWGTRRIAEIRRRDVADLLDRIETDNGRVMADRVLAAVRKLMNWYAARSDDFVSPVVKGMARTKPRELARVRVLTDDEIRTVWKALPAQPVFGPLVKLLLLTGQRREEVAGMRWDEIAGDLWTIPAERYKTKAANIVPLSAAARAVLDALPRVGDFVFTTNGKTPFCGFSKSKAALDKAKAKLDKDAGIAPTPDVQGWVLHDLRRTAKTLMTRAGVLPHVSERVLGHVIAGVEGVYDRHGYVAEKRDALDRLAAMVDRIVNPPEGNVVPLHGAADRLAAPAAA